MNIFNKVTLKTLKKNKTRTIVTIIGIILSAAMFTAITTFISSLQDYMLNVAIYNNGGWEGVLYSSEEGIIDSLRKDSLVTNSFEGQVIGYSYLEEGQNEYKPYLYVLGADQGFMDNMPLHLTSGRLPENPGEIILPKHLSDNGGVKYSVGDTITLSLGDRTQDGRTLIQAQEFAVNEKAEPLEELKVREERTYQVVGIFQRPGFEVYSAAGYTAITVMDEDIEGYFTDVYFEVSEPKEIYDFLEDFSSEESDSFVSYSTNSDVLMYRGASSYDSFYSVLYGLAAILIGLIVFGSVSLIYNAFAISVSERTKQFGLLSSVGATKKQLGRSVIFEAFFLSIIGIPLGILSGILGIGITLSLVGSIMTASATDGAVVLSLSVSTLSVIVAALLALLTVLISAYIPSRRATKISAIDAIRQSEDIKVKAKDFKTNKLVYKFFGLEGMLAEKHYKRNKKRYRATVLSLFISVVLFISASSFVSYLTGSVNQSIQIRDFDISYIFPGTDVEIEEIVAMKDRLSSVEGITKSTYVFSANSSGTIDEAMASDRLKELLEGNEDISVPVLVLGIEDSLFLQYLEDNNFHKDIYMNPEKPLAIATDWIQLYYPEQERFVNFNAFKEKQGIINYQGLDEEKYYEHSDEERESIPPEEFYVYYPMEIGTVTEELPYGARVYYGDAVLLFYAESILDKVLPRDEINDIRIFLSAEDHAAANDKLIEVLEENGMSTDNLQDYAAWEENDRNTILIINVFSYGFIVLISLIAVANVFNTISTGINLRRREFAMLKSVGMTQKGFNKMMTFESILYGFKGLIYGLPVAFLVTYGIYRSVDSGIEADFYVPITAIIIAILSVFVVVFASTIYSMKKIKKDNPIDALKNENL